MFFCKPCLPKVSLFLKFFNDIQEQQSDINSRIGKFEEQVTKLVENTQHSRPVQPENSKVLRALNDSQNRKASMNSDRNFIIVIFGIEESPPQTSRFDRQKHDLGKILNSISCIDSSFSAASIRDFHQLGKFKHNVPKPHPILVKFLMPTWCSQIEVLSNLLRYQLKLISLKMNAKLRILY